MPLNLVFFGPPGAGKGTQADRFAARHRIPKISTGDMLRKAIQDGTRVGAIVRDTLQRGALVGDDLIISIVAERLEQPDTANGFVLDGFPRTIPQAAALDALLVDRGGLSVIALVVHADEVIRRLAGRGREDDEAFVIKERLVGLLARDRTSARILPAPQCGRDSRWKSAARRSERQHRASCQKQKDLTGAQEIRREKNFLKTPEQVRPRRTTRVA